MLSKDSVQGISVDYVGSGPGTFLFDHLVKLVAVFRSPFLGDQGPVGLKSMSARKFAAFLDNG